jgi:hypothetical protein
LLLRFQDERSKSPSLELQVSCSGRERERCSPAVRRANSKPPKQKCRGTESNRRHKDFQSSALPTELPRHENVALIEENINILPIAHRPGSQAKNGLPEHVRCHTYRPRPFNSWACTPLPYTCAHGHIHASSMRTKSR